MLSLMGERSSAAGPVEVLMLVESVFRFDRTFPDTEDWPNLELGRVVLFLALFEWGALFSLYIIAVNLW